MTGSEFATARKAMGLSQSKLAKRMGFEVVTISCKENDRRRVTKRDELSLLQIAHELKIEARMPKECVRVVEKPAKAKKIKKKSKK